MGQRVFATGRNTGSYAEFLVSESSYVFPLHERLSFAQGCYSMDISFILSLSLVIGLRHG